MRKVLRKTKQNQNRKEIKALHGFFIIIYSQLLRISKTVFPLCSLLWWVCFFCILKTFIQCEAVAWLPGQRAVSKPKVLPCKPGPHQNFPHVSGSCLRESHFFPHYFHHPYFYGGALLAQYLFLSHTNQLQSLGSAKNGLFIFIRALVRISALIKWNMCLMSLFTF